MKTIRIVSDVIDTHRLYYIEKRWYWWPFWTYIPGSMSWSLVEAKAIFDNMVIKKPKLIYNEA